MSFPAERAKHFGFVDLIFLPRRISTDELLKWFALQDASVATDASFQNMSMPAECFQGLITKQNWRHRWSALRWEKSQEGGEQASDPSECLQLKVQGKETDINPLLLADCIQAEVQIGVWKPLFSCKFDHSSHFTLLDLQTAYRTVILLRIGESPNSLAVYSLLIFRSDITVTLISRLSLLKQRRGFQAHSDFCI